MLSLHDALPICAGPESSVSPSTRCGRCSNSRLEARLPAPRCATSPRRTLRMCARRSPISSGWSVCSPLRRSEEHTSELHSLIRISFSFFFFYLSSFFFSSLFFFFFFFFFF